MKRRSFSFAALLLALLQGQAIAADVTGSWEYRGPAESGMWLKTEQKRENVRFQLELQRGAPSYNSGWIEGDLVLSDNRGTFRKRTGSGICEIIFRFYSKRVELKPSGDELGCQFGYNVFAEGSLSRKSRQKPKFSDGDPRFAQ